MFAATSQQCFSLTPNQHQSTATSQPAVLFSHNKSAPAISDSTANKVTVTLPFVKFFYYYQKAYGCGVRSSVFAKPGAILSWQS